MSHKSEKIAAMIQSFQGGEFDPHYLGFFKCFNQQQYFEAHEVLEELWLAQRGKANGRFYKALIQLAGAFVHIRKERRLPAIALFKLCDDNLSIYPSPHEALDISKTRDMIRSWILVLETDAQFRSTLATRTWPNLRLEGSA